VDWAVVWVRSVESRWNESGCEGECSRPKEPMGEEWIAEMRRHIASAGPLGLMVAAAAVVVTAVAVVPWEGLCPSGSVSGSFAGNAALPPLPGRSEGPH